MMPSEDHSTDFSAPPMVEGIARVVAVEGSVVWLEPEQTSTCGACSSSSMCGAKGIGTAANSLERRRFPMDNQEKLTLGERVVVGVRENALVKASLTAYAIPLITLLVAGIVAQGMVGNDAITMLAMVAGLVIGLIVARISAKRLSTRGDLAPQFLRRAHAGETCHIE
ncbi:MAG: SoxR reducing system RseC family protein [Thiothrix sp.]|uniref:SoxR reducing system RseC family protein n=1 Tax=Thiothrix sp. TaxID=1032 RepID=UPI002606E199|nr:SoxR reducing system RseC family protein [Thiothrix sp.]MDD5394487.1 SoxR reducing system RseC family protein [Thiothrix sp.]